MSRKKLENRENELQGRLVAKTSQLKDQRAALQALSQDLAEASAETWGKLADQHQHTSGVIAALQDETAVLTETLRNVRLQIAELDQAEVDGEISKLLTENQEIRLKSNALREDFRRACAQPTRGTENQQHVLDLKTEIAQLGIAGDLTSKQIIAARRRRSEIVERLEALS
jgi:hypothetical protein